MANTAQGYFNLCQSPIHFMFICLYGDVIPGPSEMDMYFLPFIQSIQVHEYCDKLGVRNRKLGE